MPDAFRRDAKKFRMVAELAAIRTEGVESCVPVPEQEVKGKANSFSVFYWYVSCIFMSAFMSAIYVNFKGISEWPCSCILPVLRMIKGNYQ